MTKRVYPGMHWLVNIAMLTNLKRKNRTISTGAEKASDKIQNPFLA